MPPTAAEDETASMFPELEDSNPKHRALYGAAKKFNKANAERRNLLSTSKENVDGLMQKVIAAMHDCGIVKFKHEGMKCELITTKEKVTVALDTDDEEDEKDKDDDD